MENQNELRVVYIQFNNPQGDTEVVQKAAQDRAHSIAKIPGLVWKVWTYDPSSDRVGGIYLFQDLASANAYLSGSIVASMKALPGVSNFQSTVLAVNSELSQVTHAPL